MQVTVILPTYRRLEYLKEALNSVVKQTYKNFNCLIVNDYPEDSDRIKIILSELADRRFILISPQCSQGGNVARNLGLKQATGELIAFLDDDDLWFPDKLQKHVNQHKSNLKVGLVYSGVIKAWDNNLLPSVRALAPNPPENILHFMSLGKFCPRTTSSVTVLKKCFEECGFFDENLVSFQDWDIWYRIAQRYEFESISEPLVIFRQHLGRRTSASVDIRLKGLEQIIEKWKKDWLYPEQFRNHFLKQLYVSSTLNAVLLSQKKNAWHYLYCLVKSCDRPTDFILILKLLILLILNLKIYTFLAESYRKFRLFIKKQ